MGIICKGGRTEREWGGNPEFGNRRKALQPPRMEGAMEELVFARSCG